VKSLKSEQSIIFKRKFFIFQNLNLSYLDSETQSEQIILITHANGYSAECYSYLIEALRDKYRVIALDFAGHGQSESFYDFTSWDFLRDQILALIEHEKLGNIISIGHSMGGSSVLLCIMKFTNKVLKFENQYRR
jgi:pimeloyl-ACP methyl ester carboxylesterase